MKNWCIVVLVMILCVPASVAQEIPPEDSLPCFPGAYYRKAVSSTDRWTGIEGIITLPDMKLDDSRTRPTGRYMDNPSIYMGGRSGSQEIDAGLTWEVIRETDGSVSLLAKAFRPFWRNESWHNAPAVPEYYYYPGDTLRMTCKVAGEGKLLLKVELLARAGDELPEDLNSVEPIGTFSTEFDAASFGPDKMQEFKRVNAIDQYGNEGQSVEPTTARVTDAKWHEVFLWSGEQKLPMIPDRYTDMRCPDTKYFKINWDQSLDSGGETIFIFGSADENSKSLLNTW